MNKHVVCCSSLAALLLVSAELAAHHGPGAYDRAASVTVTGTVTRFEFVNPHVLIYITATGADGREIAWSGELTSPNRLARSGDGVAWHKSLLEPGDVVTLTGNPARNGAPVLLLNRVEDADGRLLTGTGR
jgi:hydrogenase maturation factor